MGQHLSKTVRKGGTYLVIEGSQFSTRTESAVYRSSGCAVIGMTAMPEAWLAREAELCYTTVSLVTDYDCWHPQHASVSTKSIMDMLKTNQTWSMESDLSAIYSWPLTDIEESWIR